MKKQVKKTKKNYNIVTKKEKDTLFRVKFQAGSGFPGVIVDYLTIVMEDEPAKYLTEEQKKLQKDLKKENKKDPENNNNAIITYNVVKIPKGKFQNMPDEKQKTFNDLVAETFNEIVTEIVSQVPEKSK